MHIKKTFLSALLALAMLLALSLPAAAAEQGLAGSIVIIHTNAVHGRLDGYARAAEMKTVYEAQGACVLLLDAGGFLSGRAYATHDGGASVIALMNAAGYDAAALAGEDRELGADTLARRAAEADFALLDGGESKVFTAPDGTTVGVFAAGGTVPADCDWTVGLSALGREAAAEVLKENGEIDILIDGHGNATLDSIKAALGGDGTVNGAVLTSAGMDFSHIGVIILKDGERVAMNLPLRTIAVSDETVAQQAAAAMDAVDEATGLDVYSDVPSTAWYAEAVRFVTAAGLMNGTGESFDPTGTLNRAMMVTVLYRMAGSPEVEAAMTFTDVPADSWYTAAVAWAIEEGITTGATETTFAPMKSVTREQLATFLYRYAGTPEPEGDDPAFSDSAAVSPYSAAAVAWAADLGIITADEDHAITPTAAANRAAVATALMRFKGEN